MFTVKAPAYADRSQETGYRRRDRRAALFGTLVAACGSDDNKTATVSTEASQTTAGTDQERSGTFDPSNFGAPATGANKWMPLKPGTQSVRLGHLNRGNRRLTHRRVFTVTDVTKRIDGVRTVVVLDQDIDGGEVAEQALDYLAEDKQGNVWYLGSYTEAYEGGQFVNAADAWLAGVNGAERRDPHAGETRARARRRTSQAKVPGDEPDIAEVVKTGQSNCVPFKCYKNVLVIQEGRRASTSTSRPASAASAPSPRYEGGEQETEELINLTQLSPRGLAELSAEALKLDRHARAEAKDVFGGSSPAKRTL